MKVFFFFFADRLTQHFNEMIKSLVTQIFFIFNLLTDWLHKNGSPQIRHSKDQPTVALAMCTSFLSVFCLILLACFGENVRKDWMYPTVCHKIKFHHKNGYNSTNMADIRKFLRHEFLTINFFWPFDDTLKTFWFSSENT